jgi:hypothetical protein
MRRINIASHRAVIGCLVVVCVCASSTLSAAAKTKDLAAAFEIKGKVADVEQQTTTSGREFLIGFRDISYEARVEQTLLERTTAGRMTLWLSLRDTTLTIRRTELSGRRHNAKCGPMKVAIGKERRLWIAFDVKHEFDEGRARLVLVDTRFALPKESLKVGAPSWVEVSGFGMTKSKVTDGLVTGLQNNPECIKNQLLNSAPEILAQVEDCIKEPLKLQQVSAN